MNEKEVKKKDNPLKIALDKCEAAFKITFVSFK